MLKLILGRAGSGKSRDILAEIRQNMALGMEGQILLVPDQYSHNAERRLCAFCGPQSSLYAEVLTFSRLYLRLAAELGGTAKKPLDGGGRMLAMALALRSVSAQLQVYTAQTLGAGLVSSLVEAADELKAACVTPELLVEAAQQATGTGGKKLGDLALILGAYDALLSGEHMDPRDRLTRLADMIPQSQMLQNARIYIDGFTDFTAQELRAVEALLHRGLDVTVALMADSGCNPQVFASAIRTADRLAEYAQSRGISVEKVEKKRKNGEKMPVIRQFAEGLFDPAASVDTESSDASEAIFLYRVADAHEACERCAALVRQLVREQGLRYRDIAVLARGFSDYAAPLQAAFQLFDIPLFVGEKTSILEKPVLALITGALDVATRNWEPEAVLAYLKTNLTGISLAQRDKLENYVLKWNIRGGKWLTEEAWSDDPRGYNQTPDEGAAQLLAEIDSTRRQVAAPLGRYIRRAKRADTALGQVRALYRFLEEIGLYGRLEEKAAAFQADRHPELGAEYLQLWDILMNALEQFANILGDAPLSMEDFGELFPLVLSQYQVASIPMSLDKVTAGDMDRARRDGIKCLFLLGATDDRLPSVQQAGGVLSDADRRLLTDLGIGWFESPESRLYREMELIYETVSLPTERLYLFCPETDSGQELRPSFVFLQAAERFGLPVQRPGLDLRYLTQAQRPCFRLALSGEDPTLAAAAAACLDTDPDWAERLQRVRQASALERGRLSAAAVQRLYGSKLLLSASRVDKYHSCRFAYFLQFGLQARPRTKATLDAPLYGTFMHFILEHVTQEVKALGGFHQVQPAQLRAITARYVEDFVQQELGGLEGRSGRFRYLFARLVKSAQRVVTDMGAELACSQFEPLSFELRFAEGGDLPPVDIKAGDVALRLNGVVDRVDGWIHEDKLYLRVVDYKTGVKPFNLSDIWYGMGMQMLLYLFVLQEEGSAYYGKEIVPAGVLYAPARDVVVSVSRGASAEEMEKQVAKELVRSGLLLEDAKVLEAMESGKPKYLPVRLNREGDYSGALASAEQLGQLRWHIYQTLEEMGRALSEGNITADPYYRSQRDTACLYCDFYQACHFDKRRGDQARRLQPMRPEEVWGRLADEEKGDEAHG